jgi:hypothetical protein
VSYLPNYTGSKNTISVQAILGINARPYLKEKMIYGKVKSPNKAVAIGIKDPLFPLGLT